MIGKKEQRAMVRLTILYGQPTDPAAFDHYYWNVHIPLAKKMKGWSRWTVEPVQAPLGADDAASADVPHFATGGATFLVTEEHQIDI